VSGTGNDLRNIGVGGSGNGFLKGGKARDVTTGGLGAMSFFSLQRWLRFWMWVGEGDSLQLAVDALFQAIGNDVLLRMSMVVPSNVRRPTFS
jgi:hypothetical protein